MGAGVEELANGGGTALTALDERVAELGFERLKLLAYSGLRAMYLPRGGAEAAGVDNGAKAA